MTLSLSIFCLILGAVLGSFVCCQARRAFKKDKNRWSHCDSCNKKLKWYDKIPIVSWLILRGRCRNCDKKIGQVEFWSEVIGAVVVFLMFWAWPHSLGGPEGMIAGDLKSYAVFGIFLLFFVIFGELVLSDIMYKKMLNKKIWLLVASGVLFCTTRLMLFGGNLANELLYILLSVLILWGIYYVLNKISRGKWVGDGDALVALACALILAHPEMAIWDLFLANLMGVVLVLTFKHFTGKRKKYIPMLPFLFVGFCMVFVFFFDFYHM